MVIKNDFHQLLSHIHCVVLGRMMNQLTIKQAVAISGIGLHSGKRVNLRILPAKANFGIRFIRSDINDATEIRANVKNVKSTNLATTIGSNGVKISTIEHLIERTLGPWELTMLFVK